MENKNAFFTWFSLAPIQLFLLLSATAVLLIGINWIYPDLLAIPGN